MRKREKEMEALPQSVYQKEMHLFGVVDVVVDLRSSPVPVLLLGRPFLLTSISLLLCKTPLLLMPTLVCFKPSYLDTCPLYIHTHTHTHTQDIHILHPFSIMLPHIFYIHTRAHAQSICPASCETIHHTQSKLYV